MKRRVLARVDFQNPQNFLAELQRHAQIADDALACGESGQNKPHILREVFDGQRTAAPGDEGRRRFRPAPAVSDGDGCERRQGGLEVGGGPRDKAALAVQREQQRAVRPGHLHGEVGDGLRGLPPIERGAEGAGDPLDAFADLLGLLPRLVIHLGVGDGCADLIGDRVQQLHLADREQAAAAAHGVEDADDMVAGLQRNADQRRHPLAVNGAGAVAVVGADILHGGRRLELQHPAGDALAHARLHGLGRLAADVAGRL